MGMKQSYSVIVAIIIVLSTLYVLPSTLVSASDTRQLPFTIYGYVYNETDKPQPSVLIYAKNTRTNEVISTVSDSKGAYVVECLNFPSGIIDGDKIVITAIDTATNKSAYAEVIVRADENGKRIDLHLSSGKAVESEETVGTSINIIQVANPTTTTSIIMQAITLIIILIMAIIMLLHYKKRELKKL